MILDGVYNDVKDADGFEAECLQGRQMGFDGKTLIHPSQVEPCNRVFAPSDDEIAHAREIIDAFEAATAEGKGVVTFNGRMIENLHVDNARRVLAVADAIAAQSSTLRPRPRTLHPAIWCRFRRYSTGICAQVAARS